MDKASNIYSISQYRESDFYDQFNQQSIDRGQFQVQAFKQKYVFRPFNYEERLQQTLSHQIKKLNPQPLRQSQIQKHKNDHKQSLICGKGFQNQFTTPGNASNNVHFRGQTYFQSINSTSKSIKTNKTIWGTDTPQSHSNPKNGISSNVNSNSNSKCINNLSQVNQILTKSLLGKPPNLLMKKQISLATNAKSQMIQTFQDQKSEKFQTDNRTIVFNSRSMKKKTLFCKEKYDEEKKTKQNKSNYKLTEQTQSKSFTNPNSTVEAIFQHGNSLCQSIALGSTLVQNFMRSTYQNGFFNSQTISNTSGGKNIPEPLTFFSFCMLLFPQSPKSIPCPTFVIDTLFYTSTNQSKDIIYVFKDRKMNMLVKMKNKNKCAFQLFLKRRQHYEVNKLKEDKLKKAGYYKQKNIQKAIKNQAHLTKKTFTKMKMTCSDQSQNELNSHTKKQFNSSLKCFQEQNSQSIPAKQDLQNSQIIQQNSYEQNQNQDCLENDDNQIQRESQNSQNQSKQFNEDQMPLITQHSELNEKATKHSFKTTHKKFITSKYLERHENNSHQSNQNQEQSPIITPSNSIRESFHSLQTNYLALLKYHNNHIIRLKIHQFKAIFHNPLYANERFKNNNNTQYIQALPIQEEDQDIKVYSMHFHYEIFKDQQLFLYVKQSLYKQNQYMKNNTKNSFQQKSHNQNRKKNQHTDSWSNTIQSEKKKSQQLKKKLKQTNSDMYLYYQIFQMYTYISMHYNKQILNGIFRFVQYNNQFALFQTQNVIVKQLPKEGQFIQAKIFRQQNVFSFNSTTPQNLQKIPGIDLTITPSSLNSEITTPSQTMKKINRQILKLSLQSSFSSSELQKQITTYFDKQNIKIEKDMTEYFTQKIEKIQNVKDMQLSKNIFKIINIQAIQKQHQQKQRLKQMRLTPRQKEYLQKLSKLQDSNNQKFYSSSKQQYQNQVNFHALLNDQNKFENFLKKKDMNDPYGRKNISNYSVVRWKKQLNKVRKAKTSLQGCKQNLSASNLISNVQKEIRKPRLSNSKTDIHSQIFKESSIGVRNNRNKTILQGTTLQVMNNMRTKQSKVQNDLNNQKQVKGLKQVQITKENQKLQKRFINEKYTQFNRSNFKLVGFKTDKFI